MLIKIVKDCDPWLYYNCNIFTQVNGYLIKSLKLASTAVQSKLYSKLCLNNLSDDITIVTKWTVTIFYNCYKYSDSKQSNVFFIFQ